MVVPSVHLKPPFGCFTGRPVHPFVLYCFQRTSDTKSIMVKKAFLKNVVNTPKNVVNGSKNVVSEENGDGENGGFGGEILAGF